MHSFSTRIRFYMVFQYLLNQALAENIRPVFPLAQKKTAPEGGAVKVGSRAESMTTLEECEK